jgi:hypothetical protein
VLLRENTKSKCAFLLNVYLFEFILSMRNHKLSFSFSVFKTEPELSLVNHAVLIDLSSNTLGKSVDEPAFVDGSVATVFASLVLQDSPKAVVCLGVDQDLSIVDEVISLFDTHELQL